MSGAGLRIRSMVRKEFRQLLRDPRTRMMIFVAPLIQLVMFGYAVNTDIRNTATVVVDLDRTAESRALVDAFGASGYFEIVQRSLRSSDIARALDRGDAVVGIEIPHGFSRDLALGKAAVQIVVDGSNSSIATVAQGYAARIVQRFAAERVPHWAAGVDLRTRAWYNPNLESRVYNVPAVIGVLVLMMSLLLTALAVVRERELGTLDQLMVSPLSPAEFVAAKTLPVAFIGLVDLFLITAVAVFWFDIPMRGSLLALLPAALLYILAGLSFGLLISSVSKTQQEAFMAMFLFLLPAIILSGFFYPIRSMPLPFQWLTVLNPVRHFLEIVRAVFLKGEGIGGLWVQYLAIGLFALVAIRAAIWRLPRTIGGS
ncbi:MAG: transport permease protein [Gemmatimonadales bacterium]|nr:Inner membrane transport permease YbhR [bacterium HR33]GIW52340.1 MAG: transport permease protein [Gemmatimonadales bacterium]